MLKMWHGIQTYYRLVQFHNPLNKRFQTCKNKSSKSNINAQQNSADFHNEYKNNEG